MSEKILVALSTFGEYGEAPLRLLQESGVPFLLNPYGRRLVREEIIQLSKEGVTGIVAGVEPYDAPVLEALPALRCISRCGVGVDNIDRVLAKQKGIAIRNTPDVVIHPVMELTVGMIFGLLRNLAFHTKSLQNRQWVKKAGNQLAGKVVGVLGLGRIGRRVASTLRTLGAEVIGTDLQPDMAWAERAGVKVVPMETLLSAADIITIHVSASATFVLNEAAIDSMKEGAWLINTSRGDVVDEAALYAALKSDRLAGAALDVFSEEPYNGPLCDLDNVILTPHVATLTHESRVEMEFESVRNLLEFYQGR